jgi:hypothetical protein
MKKQKPFMSLICPDSNKCEKDIKKCSHLNEKVLCPKLMQNRDEMFYRLLMSKCEENAKRWNKCRQSIPLKDGKLPFYRYVRIFMGNKIIINNPDRIENWNKEEFKKEIDTLLNNGDKMESIEDYGVCEIMKDDKYILNKYIKQYKVDLIETKNVDDIIEYLIDFWNLDGQYRN